MKQLDQNTKVILLFISIVLFCGTLLGVVALDGYMHSNISGDIGVKIKGIELVDVRPYGCWITAATPEYCPIPKDIEFEYSGSMPIFMVNKYINQIEDLTTMVRYR